MLLFGIDFQYVNWILQIPYPGSSVFLRFCIFDCVWVFLTYFFYLLLDQKLVFVGVVIEVGPWSLHFTVCHFFEIHFSHVWSLRHSVAKMAHTQLLIAFYRLILTLFIVKVLEYRFLLYLRWPQYSWQPLITHHGLPSRTGVKRRICFENVRSFLSLPLFFC